jgi:hypothetical protein
MATSTLARERKSLEAARKKQAEQEKKAASAEGDVAKLLDRASRTASASSRQGYLRQADQKTKAANKARQEAAKNSAAVATAQGKVHKAEEKLAKEQATEAKRAAEKTERERKKLESTRDRQIGGMGSTLENVRRGVNDAAALLESRPWENVGKKVTILFITAEPDGTTQLRIDREIRQIQEQVRSSELRDSIQFQYRPATRVSDLIQHLNEVEPDVIHFSGHGAESGIALHGKNDELVQLDNETLDQVLAVAPKPLRLVIFNSCDSESQASVAVRHAMAAIGMSEPIEDEAARLFAGQLYNALGFGRPLGLAVAQAKLIVEMNLDEPSGQPLMLTAEGVDPETLLIVDPE